MNSKNCGRNPVTDLDYEFSFVMKNGYKKGGKKWHNAIVRYYGEACCICGYYKPLVSNHCHHRIPISKDGKNTIRNGIVLCSRCHEEVHAGYLSCLTI